jgi:hypothetical protein
MNETIPLVAKLFSSFSAFLGGISIGLFWQPKQLQRLPESRPLNQENLEHQKNQPVNRHDSRRWICSINIF